MKIVFLSNYFNHHQKPFSDEMYKLIGDDYTFVETSQMPEFRKLLGYGNIAYPNYVVKFSEYNEKFQKIVDDADVVIFGSAPEFMLKARKKANKIILRYSERPLKKNISVFKYIYYFIKWNYRSLFWKPIYMLCASAYTSSDFHKFLLFYGKCYKWGYFPQVQNYGDVNTVIESKNRNSLLWVGRLIDWKHPEIVVQLAAALKKEKKTFIMNIIGTGELQEKIQHMIKDLDLGDSVHFLGPLPPEKVKEYMEKSEIFISTSDRNEGWGAVINEAMGTACATISARTVGAAPFLIKQKENGFMYDNFNDLVEYTKDCLNDSALRKKISQNAYETIFNEWNPRVAAKRFLAFSEDMIKYGNCNQFDSGPCSRV